VSDQRQVDESDEALMPPTFELLRLSSCIADHHPTATTSAIAATASTSLAVALTALTVRTSVVAHDRGHEVHVAEAACPPDAARGWR
jgi:hypothetical protein